MNRKSRQGGPPAQPSHNRATVSENVPSVPGFPGFHNTASATTQVNFGSSDSDQFSYDPNTGAMTQYNFNVGSQSVTGALTWNPLGTLASLGITDPFDSSDAQTCSYSHDDLTRISSANCGSIWSQTFSYDVFGNISKSGNSSFAPVYSTSTNQMTSIGSSTPTYDANGNVTNDFLHTYAWDSNGRPVTVDGVGVTYDALGDMVEQNRSGTYTEIAYAPSLGKLALMSGTTLQKGFVPLTGGAAAVYNSSGLAYYRHSDWLGSSRFASTTSQTMYFDGAYAPFSEPYAQTGTSDLSFTGQNQDTVSNLYDFPAREYGIQGRWPSPDPAGIAAADPADPQTWNRYGYVRNSPLNMTDPTGMLQLVNPPNYGEEDPNGYLPPLCFGGFSFDYGVGDDGLNNGNYGGASCGVGATFGNGGGIGPGPKKGKKSQPPPAPQTPTPQQTRKKTCTPLANNLQGTQAAGVELSWTPYRLTHPVDMAVVNVGIFFGGGAAIVGGAGAIVAGCAEPTPAEPLTCGAGIFGGAQTIAGGAFLVKQGVSFFNNITLPAIKDWGCHG